MRLLIVVILSVWAAVAGGLQEGLASAYPTSATSTSSSSPPPPTPAPFINLSPYRGVPLPACQPGGTAWESRLAAFVARPIPATAAGLAGVRGEVFSLLIGDLTSLKGNKKATSIISTPRECITPPALAAMMRALIGLCVAGLPPPSVEEGEALVSLSSILFRAAVTTGSDLSPCISQNQQLGAAKGGVGIGIGIGTTLYACAPGHAGGKCSAADVWRSDLSLLIPYLFHTWQAAVLGLLATPNALKEVKAVLTMGLCGNKDVNQCARVSPSLANTSLDALGVSNGGSSASSPPFPWHPTGWPPVSTPPHAMTITPQPVFYFSTSYYFVELEAVFKREMHERIAWALPRVPALAAAAEGRRSEMPSFSFAGEKCTQKKNSSTTIPRILIVSSFWEKTHSSHRMTSPLLKSLARHSPCTSLLFASSSSSGARRHDTFAEFHQAFPFDLADGDLAGALALSYAISAANFTAIIYPSVGMSPPDVALASLRLAPTQLTLYGHSSSTHSPAMDYFIGGLEPEVLGPVAAGIYDVLADCTAVSDALQKLAAACIRPSGEGGNASSTDPPSSMPFMSFCDKNGVCRPSEVAVTRDVGAVLQGFTGQCRTTFDSGSSSSSSSSASTSSPSLFAGALTKRLRDAQQRYSERLLLLPGLGLWFSDEFPSIASRSQGGKLGYPPLDALLGPAKVWAKLAWGDAAGLPLIGAGLSSGANAESSGADTWLPAFLNASSTGPGQAGSSSSSLLSIPAGGADTPLRVALVWSQVKWNPASTARLVRILKAAQMRFAAGWHACKAALQEGGGGSGRGRGREEVDGVRAVCNAVLAAHPSPGLHILVTVFISMDTAADPLQALAVAAHLRSAIEPHFQARRGGDSSGGEGGGAATGAAADTGGVIVEPLTTGAETPEAYLSLLGGSDVAIDSQPFSACNTMQDLLSLSIPVVSASHDGVFEPATSTPLRWRSSIGASILSKAGLSGLVALDSEEFVEKNSALLSDPFLRAAWRSRMSSSSWRQLLSDSARAERDAGHVDALLRV